jgi:DNA replication protein DnaC
MQKIDGDLFSGIHNDLGEVVTALDSFPNDTECPRCHNFDTADPRVIAIIKARQAARPATTKGLMEWAACKCAKLDQELAATTLNRRLRAHLPTGQLARTFDNFQPRSGSEDMLAAGKAFCAGAYTFLTITVNPGDQNKMFGNGKTHLMEAMARDLLEQGKEVRFDLCKDILDRLRATYNRNADTDFAQVLDEYKYFGVLFLDDLGMEKSNAWGSEQLTGLIEERIQNNRRTVISTNLNREAMMNLEPRLASRLFATNPALAEVFKVVVNTATDFRR